MEPQLDMHTAVGRLWARIEVPQAGGLLLRVSAGDDPSGDAVSDRGVVYRLSLTIPVDSSGLRWLWTDTRIVGTRRRLSDGRWISIARIPAPDWGWLHVSVIPAVSEWMRDHDSDVAALFERSIQRALRVARAQVTSYEYVVHRQQRNDLAPVLADKRHLQGRYEKYLADWCLKGGL